MRFLFSTSITRRKNKAILNVKVQDLFEILVIIDDYCIRSSHKNKHPFPFLRAFQDTEHIFTIDFNVSYRLFYFYLIRLILFIASFYSIFFITPYAIFRSLSS